MHSGMYHRRWKKAHRGAAALLCTAVLCAGTAADAAPSLARPEADIAGELLTPEIGVEDRTPTYQQDHYDATFTVENFILEAPDLNLDKAPLVTLLQEGMGKGKTIADLRRTVDALTTYCRTHGYPAAAGQPGRDGRPAHHPGTL